MKAEFDTHVVHPFYFSTVKHCIFFLIVVLLFSQVSAQESDTVSVFFNTDSYIPLNSDALKKQLSSRINSGVEVDVIGYADYVGTTAYNQVLSNNRAQAVAIWLKEQFPDKIQVRKIIAFGELADSHSDNVQGDARSRRVDLVIQTDAPISTSIDTTNIPEPKPFVKDGIGVTPELPATNEVLEIDLSEDGDTNIVLEGVGFIPGRHYPLPESRPQLERLLNTMKRYPDLRIEIQGFICCEYDQFDGLDIDTQTMNLSENRAKFIYDFLIREGIDADRLQYKGYGSSKPKVMPENTPEDQQANRRVEIKILDK